MRGTGIPFPAALPFPFSLFIAGAATKVTLWAAAGRGFLTSCCISSAESAGPAHVCSSGPQNGQHRGITAVLEKHTGAWALPQIS